jgi:anti-sigma factor RsiW
MNDEEKSERVLKALLSRASPPQLPEGAEERLMRIVRQTQQENKVVALPRRRANALLWLGLPLAAALAAGIYVGSLQSFDRLVTGLEQAGLDIALPSGLEDEDDGLEDVS